jgi:hypothetical protein
MDKLRDLANALRKRASKLREIASECTPAQDRYALEVRADEAALCAVKIEAMLPKESTSEH